MIDIKNLKITEFTPLILRELECILDEDKKAKIMKILNGEYKKYYTEFIRIHKNPKYRDIAENWLMYGSIVFDTSKFDTHKYTFFDQDNTYFLLDTEAGMKDFKDYLDAAVESSEKEWRPKYPIMTISSRSTGIIILGLKTFWLRPSALKIVNTPGLYQRTGSFQWSLVLMILGVRSIRWLC